MTKFILILILANGSQIEKSDPMSEGECKRKGRQMVASHVLVKKYICHPYIIVAEEENAHVSER